MTVFVYEDVCATGAGGDESSPPAPSLLAEGRAMLEAVTSDVRAVANVLTTETATDFDRLAAAADWTLVIAPECGGRLEHLCRRVLSVGGKLLGPSPDAVRRTTDKLELFHHWMSHGVATPRTWLLSTEGQFSDLSVIKPRDGAGSQATRLSHMPATPWPGELIAQSYIEGVAASVACLVGPAGIDPLIPCEQILSTEGRFQYRGGRLPIAPDLADRAVAIAGRAVACVPGLLGYVGVDVVLGTDGRDWAIEINPRITTSYVGLRRLAEVNLLETMLAVVRGNRAELRWRAGSVEFSPSGAVEFRPPPPNPRGV